MVTDAQVIAAVRALYVGAEALSDAELLAEVGTGVKRVKAALEAAEKAARSYALDELARLGQEFDASSGKDAEELTRLRAEVERLRAALKPFAEAADIYDPPEDDDDHPAWGVNLPIGDLRRAREAMGEG